MMEIHRGFDLIAAQIAVFGYLLGSVVCSTWVGIAIAYILAGRHRLQWTQLAIAMAAAGVSLSLMGIYVAWRPLPYPDILAITRFTWTVAAVFGATFTTVYLSILYRNSSRRIPPTTPVPPRPEEEPTP